MHKALNIVFMGTPDFAVPSLEKLHDSVHTVSLVVTQPDRPQGRGRKIQPPPVKAAAAAMGYDILQPRSIRGPEFLDRIRSSRPDVIVVIAFGRILPQPVLDLPPYGAVNIHASLLPKYRGPAPIQWAIINGETETGVTAMRMDAGLDTGDILLTKKTAIGPDDTSGALHDRLAQMGAELLAETFEKLASGDIHPAAQDDSLATHAPLLRKKDGHIDWTKEAGAIECMIRGMDPWPGAFTFLNGKRLKIFKAETVPGDTAAPPGTAIEGFPDELRVAAGSGALSIIEIQGASGKRLSIHDFLRGCKLTPGTMFT